MAQLRTMIKLSAIVVVLTILLANQDYQVTAGRRKLMMGMALAAAMRHNARENSLLRVLIPIRIASEAWKKYGEMAAENKHYNHHHHGHYDYIDHSDDQHLHCH